MNTNWYNRNKAMVSAAKQKQEVAIAELMWQQSASERAAQAAGLATRYRVAPYVPDVPKATLEPRIELCLVGRY